MQDNVLGVTYDTNPITLKVQVTSEDILDDSKVVGSRLVAHPILLQGDTVIDDEGKPQKNEDGSLVNKVDDITNKYSAGKLEVSKSVTGNLGDKSKYFEVKVKFTNPTDKTWDPNILVSGGSYYEGTQEYVKEENGKEFTVNLKHGDTIHFDNIPYGVTYTVEETNYTGENGGYETAEYKFSDSSNKIDTANDTVLITNKKEALVDTGISLDSVPYILILGLAVVGIGALFFRKRENANF